MTELTLDGVKSGDRICIARRLSNPQLVIVDKVTPSGRVVTKYGTFKPDGYRYGGHEDWWNRSRAHVATEDDIAGIRRAVLVSKVERFRRWDRLNPDDLEIVLSIIQKHP